VLALSGIPKPDAAVFSTDCSFECVQSTVDAEYVIVALGSASAQAQSFELISNYWIICSDETAVTCSSGAHFQTFVISGASSDGLLARLYRKGLFLLRTWDMVPAFYRSFVGTFPLGSKGSKLLASNITPISLNPFQTVRKRNRLICAIKQHL
jgi:hypothetical protein